MFFEPNLRRFHLQSSAILLLLTIVLLASCSSEPKKPKLPPVTGLISFPLEIDRECRDGAAKIYDECSDQFAIYDDARKKALAEDKVLLVSYGAEWCIWCHVFEKYVRGEYDDFTHTYSDEDDTERYTDIFYENAENNVGPQARELAQYVADNFVLVHIEYKYAPNSDEALMASGANAFYNNNLPYIYTVKSDGSFAKRFDNVPVEARREGLDWFRGYDRRKLLQALKDMKAAASQ